jgi:hypothetical protein
LSLRQPNTPEFVPIRKKLHELLRKKNLMGKKITFTVNSLGTAVCPSESYRI